MPLIVCYFEISNHGKYIDYNKFVIHGLAGEYFYPQQRNLGRKKKASKLSCVLWSQEEEKENLHFAGLLLPARHCISQTTDLKQEWGGDHSTGRKGAFG